MSEKIKGNIFKSKRIQIIKKIAIHFLIFVVEAIVVFVVFKSLFEKDISILSDFVVILKDIALALVPFYTLYINHKNQIKTFENTVELKKMDNENELNKELNREKNIAIKNYITSINNLIYSYNNQNLIKYKENYYLLLSYFDEPKIIRKLHEVDDDLCYEIEDENINSVEFKTNVEDTLKDLLKIISLKDKENEKN